MTHGIQLRNGSGRVYFDTSNTTWNFLSYQVARAGETLVWDVPLSEFCNTIEVQRSYMNTILGDQESYVHNVAQEGTTFTASEGRVDTAIFIVGR